MRLLLLGLATAVLVLPAAIQTAQAQRQPRPWCLVAGADGPGGGLPDCSYQTLQQCRAAIGGGPDGCISNPALGWNQTEGKRPRGNPRPGGQY